MPTNRQVAHNTPFHAPTPAHDKRHTSPHALSLTIQGQRSRAANIRQGVSTVGPLLVNVGPKYVVLVRNLPTRFSFTQEGQILEYKLNTGPLLA